MQANGGTSYEARGVAFTRPPEDQCLLCHGTGRIADVDWVHLHAAH